MKRRDWIITVAICVIVVGLFLLSRFGDDTAPGVAPSAKMQIDRLAAEHDCAGLQHWFDATTNAAAGQLNYIDHKMRDAGCYDD